MCISDKFKCFVMDQFYKYLKLTLHFKGCEDICRFFKDQCFQTKQKKQL